MLEVDVRPSQTEGLGVFAVRRFAEGEFIREFELAREVTAKAPLHTDVGEAAEHCTYIADRVYLVASPDRHFNHSCDPNAFLRFTSERIEVIARREIQPDEEITLDYLINNSGGDSWPCRCGAARCRGETGTSFFELPARIRAEYMPLLAPWFAAQHAVKLAKLQRSPPAAQQGNGADGPFPGVPGRV